MFQAILHLIKKEFLQTLRDPRLRFTILAAPVIQLILFGYAITTDIKEIPTVVCDLDRTQESRDLVGAMQASTCFDIAYQVEAPKEMEALLRQSRVKFGLLIPKGFSRSGKRMEKASVLSLLDGTDSNSATVALNYLNQMLGERSERQMAGSRMRLQAMGTSLRAGQVALQALILYNPGLLSAPYMVPGVIALILTLTTLLLTAMGIAREREMGTIEQLMVSPLRPEELILGKTLPYVAIGLVNVLFILVVAVFWFQVPMRGSLLLLLLSSTVFLLGALGIGLFVSASTRNVQVAFQFSILLTMLPALLLSGFFYPIENMPRILRAVTYLVPARYFLVIIRGIFLKGVGLAVLWRELLFLVGFAALMLIASSAKFHKRLE
jgi:ABC-2 type transport system permease protein